MTVFASSNERAQAALDRSIVRNWQPARGAQMALAMVDGLLKNPNNGPVQARIAENVRTMR